MDTCLSDRTERPRPSGLPSDLRRNRLLVVDAAIGWYVALMRWDAVDVGLDFRRGALRRLNRQA